MKDAIQQPPDGARCVSVASASDQPGDSIASITAGARRCSFAKRIVPWLLAAMFCAGIPFSLLAIAPPRPGELLELEKQGTLANRVAKAKMRDSHKVSRQLIDRASVKIERARLKAAGVPDEEVERMRPLPPPNWRNLPTTGTPKTLTLLIDFKDYRASTVIPSITAANVAANIYGNGSTAAQNFFPVESVRAYYRRASQNLLSIDGSVLGWYHFSNNRSQYEPASNSAQAENQAIFDMVKQALNSFVQSHDIAQYDNNGDGYIDTINILYTGPDTGWSSFWWAYQWEFFIPDAEKTLFDGKKLRGFVWSFVDTRNGGTDFDPLVLIHETGHALGLPDYYDYTPGSDDGPEGGVGGLDMMDANKGNHNAFSRWLLDWITPEIVSAGTIRKTLNASADQASTSNKTVLLFPGASDNIFSQFFIVENRHRVGNDLGTWYGDTFVPMPSDGLLIWHVDATLDATGRDYAYNNSFTPRKLLRLVQADGLNEIEAEPGGGNADAGDYYNVGEIFTPTSTPNSNRYEGGSTGVSVTGISPDGLSMAATFAVNDTAGVPVITSPLAAIAEIGQPFTYQIVATNNPISYSASGLPGGLSIDNLTGRISGIPTALGRFTVTILATNAVGSGGQGLVLTVISGTVVPLPDALDDSTLTWQTTGSVPWFGQTGIVHDGVDAAQSGDIGNGDVSVLSSQVMGPGTLRFWWKTSSEFGYDGLSFSIGGEEVATITGETEWREVVRKIPAGAHRLQWVYFKDDSLSHGLDAGWVDQVRFEAVYTGGTYYGLVAGNPVSHENSGILRISVTGRRVASGLLKYGGKKFSLKGTFSSTGELTRIISRKGLPPLRITLTIDLDGGGGTISGTVDDGSTISTFLADRAAFKGKTNPAPQAGKYTVLTKPGEQYLGDSNYPQGIGAGSLVVSKSGQVRVVTVLGDGTRVSQSAALSTQGEWPFYATAYGGKGAMFGVVIFEDKEESDAEGVVHWFKAARPRDDFYPDGFRMESVFLASRYTKPDKGERVLELAEGLNNARFVVEGGGLAEEPGPQLLTLKANNKVIPSPGSKLKMAIATGTGLFSGTFVDPSTNKARRFAGVIFQKQNIGAGWFRGNGETGAVQLESATGTPFTSLTGRPVGDWLNELRLRRNEDSR